MNKIIIFLILFVLNIYRVFGQTENSNWVFGYTDTLLQHNCGKILVKKIQDQITFEEIETPANFSNTSSAISDKDGNLLFYTNGCCVMNSDHEIMQNGEGLNPGGISDLVCQNYGYLVPYGSLILPYPDVKSQYAIIHLSARYGEDRSLIYDRLYYSIVDISANEGKGEVISKNNIVLEEDIESFAVVRHGNGRDWWIVAPDFCKNKYNRILFDPSGFSIYDPIITGYHFPSSICENTANTLFSSDGNYYIRANSSCGFIVFNFDRCSGMLSNPIHTPLSNTLGAYGGDAVITKSNILYLISPKDIFTEKHAYYEDRILKFDLKKLGISTSFGQLLFPNTFETFDIKPQKFINFHDNELYIYTLKDKGSFFKIKNPDDKKNIIDIFKYKELPIANSNTVPYFANISLGVKTDSQCDTLVATNNEVQSRISLFPNPASNVLSIEFDGHTTNDISIEIYTAQGFIIDKYLQNVNNTKITIDIKDLFPGIYYLRIKNSNSITTFKFIKA
jgi:hypothetical protein